jgi:hypothetical protein
MSRAPRRPRRNGESRSRSRPLPASVTVRHNMLSRILPVHLTLLPNRHSPDSEIAPRRHSERSTDEPRATFRSITMCAIDQGEMLGRARTSSPRARRRGARSPCVVSMLEVEHSIGDVHHGRIVARNHDAGSEVDDRPDEFEHDGDVARRLGGWSARRRAGRSV